MNNCRNALAIALLTFCTLSAWEGAAHACSCTGALPPIQEMAEANAVFTGKVVKLTKVGASKDQPDNFMGYDVTVELDKVIKGKELKQNAKKTVTIYTGAGMGDCGYAFDEGEKYLIYAFGAFPKLETNICTRTQPLKGGENEVLELEGRLPEIATPPQPPELVLKGTIDDAGYRGYVFELRNYLHERIFYSLPVAQVFRDGKWEDYAFNADVAPQKDSPAEDVAAILSAREAAAVEEAAGREGLRGVNYLSRMSAEVIFAALQSQSLPWRVGFGYTTEREMGAHTNLTKSRHFVWGPRIENSTQAKKLTFDEAFKGTGMIPYPLGMNPTGPSSDQP